MSSVFSDAKDRPGAPVAPNAVSGTWRAALLALSRWNRGITRSSTVHLCVHFSSAAVVSNAAGH